VPVPSPDRSREVRRGGTGRAPPGAEGVANLPAMATRTRNGPGKASRKGRSSGGRATARQPGERATNDRYTPPIPKNAKVSPPWMGWLIIGLFVLGVLIIILNYADALPGGVDNWWLVAAIGSVFAGLMVATRYH